MMLAFLLLLFIMKYYFYDARLLLNASMQNNIEY